MKKKALIFISVVLLVLAIVPIVNLIGSRTAQNKKEKIWWHGSALYNFDFALPYIRGIFYPLGISTNPNQVMIGKDDWLYLGDRYKEKQDNKTLTIIRRGATSEDVKIAKKIGIATKAWGQWLKEKGVSQYQIMLGPDKGTIYSEFLPDWVQPASESVTNVLLANVSQEIYVDSRTALKQAKSQYLEPLYYKTDTHWNSLGAWVAFRTFTQNLNRKGGKLHWISEHQVRVARVKERGGGDLASFLWMKKMLRDSEVVIEIDSGLPLKTEHYDFETGHLILSDDNNPITPPRHPLLVKSKNAMNQKRVLWLRDSFGNAMAPFMAATFTETLQLRYDLATPEVFARLVNTYKPDYVFITVVERDARCWWFAELPPTIVASGSNQ
jgi:hypothetical protein